MPRRKPKPIPSRDELLAIFDYDASTGVLVFKRRPVESRSDIAFNSKCAGKIAGTVTGRPGNKYVHVGIRRSYYSAHRLVWKIMTGQEPPEFIDHKDGDRLNNRWDNLRESDNATNLHNSKLRSDNLSGVKGVSWHRNKWQACITVDGVQRRVGRFDTVEEAEAALRTERERLHGEFARFK